MLSPAQAHDRLKERGLRLTPQRRALIELLDGDTSHPRAEDIAARLAERMPGVSLSTVYKALHEFAGAGLVRELDLPGGMRFDPDPSDHVHVVCERCGRIDDVELPASVRDSLALLAPDRDVADVDVRLVAICPECRDA